MSRQAGRILVVDDDPGIREMLAIALAEGGHEVRTADGLGFVEIGDAEVLVLDVRLGARAASDLVAAQPELGRLPLVVMTASNSPADAAAGVPSPVAVIEKPFDLQTLETAVEAAVGAARADRPAGQPVS